MAANPNDENLKPENTPMTADATGFDNIVDDSEARDQASQWALEQISEGQSCEDVAAQLVANGWSQDDAEEITEQVRRQTRVRRGITTHEDARKAYGVGDPSVARQTTPFSGSRSAMGNVFHAFSRLWRTRNVGKPK